MNDLLFRQRDRLEKICLLARVFFGGPAELIRYLRAPNPRITPWLLRHFGATVGERTTFKGALILDNVFQDQHSAGDLRHLCIGDNCYIGEEVYFDLADRIQIGHNAVISGRVSILTHADCNRSPILAARHSRMTGPTILQDGVWIGFGATILAGLNVGSNALVAAGSVVVEPVPTVAKVGGVPARPLQTKST